MMIFWKLFGKKKLTTEEKIAKAKETLSGFALVSELLHIEETDLGLKEGSERHYERLVDLCAEYHAYFIIPCSGGC